MWRSWYTGTSGRPYSTLGFGEAINRRAEIEDIGASAQIARGQIPTRGRADFGEVQEAFGPRFETDFARGLIGPLTDVFRSVLNPDRGFSGAASAAQSSGVLDATLNLTLNAGASLADIARQAGDQMERAILTQQATIEGMQ